MNARRAPALALALLSTAAILLGFDLGSRAQAAATPRLRLIESNPSRVVIELTVPEYEAVERSVDGTAFAALSLPGLGLDSAAGQPRLPVKGAMIGVPIGAEVRLRILDDESRRDSLDLPPLPAPSLDLHLDPADWLPPPLDLVTDPAAAEHPADPVSLGPIARWRSQRVAAIEFRPLQYDPASRTLTFHRRLRVALEFAYPGGSPASVGRRVDEGPFEAIFQRALFNYDSARSWRAEMRPVPASLAAPSGPGPWLRMEVDADGIYRVACDDLLAAGVDLASLDPRTLRVFDAGVELALFVAGEDDGHCHPPDSLEFFGQAARSQYTYTDRNAYWLTFGGEPGRRMAERDGGGSGALATSFPANLRVEQDRVYRSYLSLTEGGDHWFWNYLPDAYDSDGNGESASADYTFQIDDLAEGEFTARLQILLHGYNADDHHTLVYLNGNLIGDAFWSGKVERRLEFDFPQALLVEGANSIRVHVPRDTSAADTVFVNRFDLAYHAGFTADADRLRFGPEAEDEWQYEVAGFTSPDLLLYDVADPSEVVRILGATVVPLEPTFTLRFADSTPGPHDYFALAADSRRPPASIVLDSASDLRAASNAADYIVIAPGAFLPGLQPLADFRAAQGMRVQAVALQDVYDEFADGQTDAQAIHDFLAHAYANWQRPAPSFVLLVGDGTFDFKNLLGTGEPTVLPPYLRIVDPWLGETASDNRLAVFDGADNLPDMAVGRLPANTVAEVEAMVAKILGYEQNPPPGDWRTRLAFVADNSYQSNGVRDSAGDFWALSDEVAGDPQYVPAPFVADRIYYNPCDGTQYAQCQLPYPPYPSAPSVRSALVAAIDDGRLLVNYVGHGWIQGWAAESLFGLPEVAALANAERWPVVLSMTCYDGYFHYPGLPSLAEAIVRREAGGALASWSASGLGVATGHDFLDQGFFTAVMQQGVTQLGPATVLAKAHLWANSAAHWDLIDTFILFGDPASRLSIPSSPTPTPTATSTGTATSTSTPTHTPTDTPSATSTVTLTPDPTFTATSTPSPTAGETFTPTPTSTGTATSVPPTPTDLPCFAITLEILPAAGGSVSLPAGNCGGGLGFLHGTPLSLFAVPAHGYYFTGWTGDIVGAENPLDLAVSADIALTANFEAYPCAFTDIAGSFARDAICEVTARGIIAPASETIFDTQGLVTRATMATFMANAYTAVMGEPAPIVPTPFTDIGHLPQDVQDDIARIYGLGVTVGTTATTYSPDLSISRNQMAVFLSRLYKSLTGDFAPAVETPFTDIDTPGEEWARDHIARIYGLGITVGTTATTYSPYLLVTREQMALFIVRLLRAAGH